MNEEKPQLENGYTSFANEIVEALARTKLNGYESRYLWALWRKTYGWHKKEDRISNSQFVEMTGLKKQHIWRTESNLIKRNIVTKLGYKISFNKNYSHWIELEQLPKKVTVTNSGIGVTNSGTKVTKYGAHKRNYTKETITKEIYPSMSFEQFWDIYPKKVDKKKTEAKWLKIPKHIQEKILSDIPLRVKGRKWIEGFVENPTTYLNGERWNDEIETGKSSALEVFKM